jgi:hypothetical protein
LSRFDTGAQTQPQQFPASDLTQLLLKSLKFLLATNGPSKKQLAQPQQRRYTLSLSRSKKGAVLSISKTLLNSEPTILRAWRWRKLGSILPLTTEKSDASSVWVVVKRPSSTVPLRGYKSSSKTWPDFATSTDVVHHSMSKEAGL